MTNGGTYSPYVKSATLHIQGKVDPEQPLIFEHSTWIRPYVAGFYAHKYEGKNITRQEAESRLDELLDYERKC